MLAAACIFAAPSVALAQAADYAREQRWAQEITPAIVVGQPIQLEAASGRKFLAIHTDVAKPRAAVILVHGMGLHPDWGLINMLRSALPEAGYVTLSIQMPVLASEARPEDYAGTFPEAVERLRTAVAWLEARGQRSIAIVAHSMGARMTNEFLATTVRPGISAWVSIGLSGELSEPKRLRVPILDLHGSRDLPAVLAGATRRAEVLRTIASSSQVQVSGADHFFTDHQDELLTWVRRFLERSFPKKGARLDLSTIQRAIAPDKSSLAPFSGIAPDKSSLAPFSSLALLFAEGEPR
jgi:pimeloyl-ACP methyl ester carboxylesterase